MDDKDIELLQSRLLRERERILRGSTRLITKEKSGNDIADQASDVSEELVRSSLSANDARTLREIELALKRIETGTYGTCEICGQEISLRRLRILPYTTRCVRCASETGG